MSPALRSSWGDDLRQGPPQGYIRDECPAERQGDFLTGRPRKARARCVKKVGYILLDGCSDRPVPSMNYSTPLERPLPRTWTRWRDRGRWGGW